MRVALLQLTVGDDPRENLARTLGFFDRAVAGGAGFILTPEMTNGLSSSRSHQAKIFRPEAQDETLAALRRKAQEAGVWVLVGSLGLQGEGPDGRFANRSLLIAPDGSLRARYDKIHMFDVDVTPTESYRESAAYAPGAQAVLAETDFAKIGLSICYDLRFGALYRALAQAGAQILTVPAAFNHLTGAAHWEILLRARAIETGCFVLAPAQTGFHPEAQGKGRKTHGHSLVVAPWGEILADGGSDAGVVFADLDLAQVDQARARVPAIAHDRAFGGPL